MLLCNYPTAGPEVTFRLCERPEGGCVTTISIAGLYSSLGKQVVSESPIPALSFCSSTMAGCAGDFVITGGGEKNMDTARDRAIMLPVYPEH